MSRIGVIVLAAGRSTRFATHGAQKLLAPLAGMSVVRRSVQAALDAAVGDVVVVTGAEAPAVEASLTGLPVRAVHAPDFAGGMAASLRRGVEALRADVDAVLIALGDQPTVRAEAYRRVVAAWASSRAAIVIPRYATGDVPAHPVLFAASVFGELLALGGDVGARAVIARDPGRVAVASLGWAAPRDVDTADDLVEVAAQLASDADQAPGRAARALESNRD